LRPRAGDATVREEAGADAAELRLRRAVMGGGTLGGEAAKAAIRAQAAAIGFDQVGFTAATAGPNDAANLSQYLAEGRHGDMAWMATTESRRADPRVLWPGAVSVICCGLNYGPAEDPLAALTDASAGAISVYARGRDYHDVMKPKLKALGRWLVEHFGGEVKVFVDTAPVMEKPLAMRAGLGWIGKHTNLVSRRFGSWLFLGEVFTTLELPPDPPETDHCGTCDQCLRACPTDALAEPYRIEPRRCISYATIEHKGEVPDDLATRFANRIYGCDDCLAVCPWNRFATPSPHSDLAARAITRGAPLTELAALDDARFRYAFAGTAIKRIGHARFRRNVEIALGNLDAGTAGRPTSPRERAPFGSTPRDGGRSESA
jgi:epoxyqueuosine reductase